ncbi:methyltransferase domain-containing protein [Altererythrobacter luteolus]|uniref:Methyltransferase domain-containing protein n=1 Tax=Pontixanthobacter luteolus TaxID=295089 RepID=A0A6I4UWC6_9SPHN|nr:class I SAM-dependent methyltransferase [Pontixanthobacter luteolus]MXP46167.1 methyltransferase domain-containing protein [Pontixanthobacter luteolus]
MGVRYDAIGLDYAKLRQSDPRIAAAIQLALGGAQTILNVGAGSGSYEPEDKDVTAVEPSSEMISQRAASAAPAVQASAESLPFADDSFDASMAVLTIHHWSDQPAGLAEMRRVTRGNIVLLTFDPAFRGFWLTDYFPDLITLDEGQMPAMDDYERWLGPVEISPVMIPHDCTDGFLSAYWRRPAAYLDDRVRRAMSSFWALGDVSEQLAALRADLESGVWEGRYGSLLAKDEIDCGYRLVVARP